MAEVLIIVAALTSSPSTITVTSFFKDGFSLILIGRRREFVLQVVLAPLLPIVSVASLLRNTFLHLLETRLQRVLRLLQSWLPQMMSRISRTSAPKSLPATMPSRVSARKRSFVYCLNGCECLQVLCRNYSDLMLSWLKN